MHRVVLAVMVAAAVMVACAEEDESASSASPTPSVASTTASATPLPSPGLTPSPTALPSPLSSSIEHGGTYFGVYLAVGPQGAPELDDAIEQLADMGIEAFGGDIACDDDAADQLGVDDDVMAVALYFETRRDAEVFAAALDPAPLGIAKVTTYCLD